MSKRNVSKNIVLIRLFLPLFFILAFSPSLAYAVGCSGTVTSGTCSGSFGEACSGSGLCSGGSYSSACYGTPNPNSCSSFNGSSYGCSWAGCTWIDGSNCYDGNGVTDGCGSNPSPWCSFCDFGIYEDTVCAGWTGQCSYYPQYCDGSCNFMSFCGGTPGDCSSYSSDTTTCGDIGCSYSSGGDCSDFNNDAWDCTVTGCVWTPIDCSSLGNSTDCNNNAPPCSWGGGTNCSDYNNDATSCGNNGACTWSGDAACPSYADSGSCGAHAGCSWSGTNCSGTVKTADGSGTLNGKTIKILVNGADAGVGEQTTDGSGNFSFPTVAASYGDIITVYLDNSSGQSERGVLVVKVTNSGSVAGRFLYQNTLNVQDDSGTNITNSDLATAKGSGIPEITTDMYNTSGSTLTIKSGKAFVVEGGGHYAPGGNTVASTGGIKIKGGSAWTATGSESIEDDGSWDANGGAFLPDTSLVTFNFTSSNETISTVGYPFYNVTFTGSGYTTDLNDDLHINNDFTLSAGTIQTDSYRISVGGNYSQSGGYFSNSSPNVMPVTGNFTMTGGTYADVTNSKLQVGGNFSLSGCTFTHSGTLIMNSTGSKTLTPGGKTINNLTLNDGLTGYWKFDEASGAPYLALDSSGNGNTLSTLTAYPGAGPIAPVNFINLRSIAFDGSSSIVDLPASAFGNYPTSGTSSTYALTFATWFKTNSNGVILGQDSSNYFGYVPALYVGTDNKMHVSLFWHPGGDSLASTATVNDNAWHHVAITYASGYTKLYIDGTYVNQSNGGNESSYGSSYRYRLGMCQTGAWGNTNGSYFYYNGWLDDVRVYNRALTATEIGRLGAGNQPQTGVGTYTLSGGPLTIGGNVTVASGTFANGGQDITVSGNWYNYGGLHTFTSGSVTLNSSSADQTVQSGSQTFYTLVAANTGSGKIITFDDAFSTTNFTDTTADSSLKFAKNTSYAISGTLSLGGTSGHQVTINTTDGTAPNFTFNMTTSAPSLSYVNVNRANASGHDITCATGCTNGTGNNVGGGTLWKFTSSAAAVNAILYGADF
ncbi:MAG: LamG domain-containing protein [Candidatus Omnitrophica bacterium]|nr:LamG domain-containing protein [Candidatus Omnitrophota bacterium]